MTKRQEVRDEIVKLDYSTLRDTNYINCTLVFEGGRPPSMINCDFIECEFVLEGAARNTQVFLTILSQSGASELVVNGMLGLKNWAPKDG